MLTTALGDFGPPADGAAWAALALALALLVPSARARALLPRVPDVTFVSVAALCAAALSAGYLHQYLRGGPRIIDATSYYLQARALAEGQVSVPFGFPSGSFRGRFLLPDASGGGLSVIFPPGYPLLLSLGFLVGAPLVVGPLVAAAIVVVTFFLALRLFGRSDVARLAALVSVCSAALRYHTADTMSHGLAAALLGGALLAALGTRPGSAALAGLLAGWLVATRPPTGLVALGVVAFSARASWPRLLAAGVAAALPVGLLLVQQRAATGRLFESTQLAYYALADGPPGCFRYGFGDGIGCLFEHGDFVRARLPDGFGLVAAAGTTLRRLKMHLLDAANLELLALAVIQGLRVSFREGEARALVLGVVGTIAVYVPFYFDGNYPGGGARLYADALPLEHVALAAVLAGSRLERLVLPAALLGFALHGSHEHGKLRDREGGRPMFEEAVLARAGVSEGLVLVDTDHGFSLGARPPRVTRGGAEGGLGGRLVVARLRGDAHDAVLWNALGRPPAYEYRFSPAEARAEPRLVPLPLDLRFPLRFEGEAEWPPLAVSGGWARPDFPACASGRRGLRLEPSPGQTLQVEIELPSPAAGRFLLRSAWVAVGTRAPSVTLRVGRSAQAIGLGLGPDEDASPCRAAGPLPVELDHGANRLEIASETPIVLDYVEVAAP